MRPFPPGLLFLLLLGLGASPARGVDLLMATDLAGCGPTAVDLACDAGGGPLTVEVTFTLDAATGLNGYDLSVRWDGGELSLLAAEQLYPDTGTPEPFLIEPSDPDTSEAVALSIVTLTTTALFRLTFRVDAGPSDGSADLWWFPNGNGLSPGSVVLGNPAGAGIEFVGATECANGLDDDGDGDVDLADVGCDDAADLSERSPLIVCDDGADNDGDGATDHPADLGCKSPSMQLEDPQCQNGLDDDGDGRIDFDGGESIFGAGAPEVTDPDPECNVPSRNKEKRCGLGAELAVLLPAWWGLRRRHGRSQR